ncbi:hypothetical protein T310_8949, partial [Rasamsonia emersonii CBS 393.64]
EEGFVFTCRRFGTIHSRGGRRIPADTDNDITTWTTLLGPLVRTACIRTQFVDMQRTTEEKWGFDNRFPANSSNSTIASGATSFLPAVMSLLSPISVTGPSINCHNSTSSLPEQDLLFGALVGMRSFWSARNSHITAPSSSVDGLYDQIAAVLHRFQKYLLFCRQQSHYYSIFCR